MSKEKTKFQSKVTTPTTTLQPAPVNNYLSYPHHFYMVTTWLRQPTTFFIFFLFFAYLSHTLLFNFCRKS